MGKLWRATIAVLPLDGEGFSNFALQRYDVTFASSRASIQNPRDVLISNEKTSSYWPFSTYGPLGKRCEFVG